MAVANLLSERERDAREWMGTVDGLVNAEIKAQVSGYLVKQEYTEGSFVRQGQLLFQIDPRPFQVELDQTEERLGQSQGRLAQGRAQPAQDVDRYTPLFQRHAITEQGLDNSTQNNMAATAELLARPVMRDVAPLLSRQEEQPDEHHTAT